MTMSTPLMAGPSKSPMLFVPWIKAFAVTNSDGWTKRGTADTKAGPKMVETIDVKKIRTYRPSRERRSRANKAGMRKVMTVRIKSTHTITVFFGRRSSNTPIIGPNSKGGMVWSNPTTVILRAEPVRVYTNQSRATLLRPSPI